MGRQTLGASFTPDAVALQTRSVNWNGGSSIASKHALQRAYSVGPAAPIHEIGSAAPLRKMATGKLMIPQQRELTDDPELNEIMVLLTNSGMCFAYDPTYLARLPEESVGNTMRYSRNVYKFIVDKSAELFMPILLVLMVVLGINVLISYWDNPTMATSVLFALSILVVPPIFVISLRKLRHGGPSD